MSGPRSLNGTYDAHVFTSRAVELIEQHDASEPLYLYLAYHNVHDACASDRFALGLQAPLGTVEREYSTTALDTWKVQGAMTTELDLGVGNVTAALRAAGLWDSTLLVFMSDNGGPLDHTSNYPFRMGKGHEFEGGYRVVAFASGPALPPAVRGTRLDAMMHASDWYATLTGAAGFAPPADTGPTPADGLNLWPALIGANLTSPRVEVIHAVNNRYFNPSLGNVAVQAARFGKYKLILGVNCSLPSNKVWQAWPAPAAGAVPFGRSGGVVEAGTDHARAPLLEDAPNRSELATGATAAAAHPCLFDLEADPSERHDLAADPQHAELLASLVARLKRRADTGPDIALAFPLGQLNKTCGAAVCEQEEQTGYLEPVDWVH